MITIQDMITRFGEQEMAERSNHENYETIDEAVMAAAIADAEEEAASYLRAAKLFFTNDTAPQVLKIKVCDIARYYLYERCGNRYCRRALSVGNRLAEDGRQKSEYAGRKPRIG